MARKQLNLTPRTNPTSPTTEEGTTTSKSSPFGAARAVDTSAREQEAMERAQKREEERRAGIEAAKQKRIAEAAAREKEQNNKESAGGLGITTEPKRVHPSRQNGAQAQAPNARPTHQNAKRESFNRQSSGSGAAPVALASPVPVSNVPEVDADGFTIATGSAGRKAAARESKIANDQKEAQAANKPKFSFAAAAGVGDFIEGEETSGGVDGVTEGVKDVQI